VLRSGATRSGLDCYLSAPARPLCTHDQATIKTQIHPGLVPWSDAITPCPTTIRWPCAGCRSILSPAWGLTGRSSLRWRWWRGSDHRGRLALTPGCRLWHPGRSRRCRRNERRYSPPDSDCGLPCWLESRRPAARWAMAWQTHRAPARPGCDFPGAARRLAVGRGHASIRLGALSGPWRRSNARNSRPAQLGAGVL